MVIDRNKTVSFAGHRTFKMAAAGENNLFSAVYKAADTQAIYDNVYRTVVSLIDRGYDTFLCGMAEGFDLLAGKAVADIKGDAANAAGAVRLVAVLPHARQSDMFSVKARQLYDSIMEAADEVTLVSEQYRHHCFHRRNDYLVDNSSVVVCFYNGAKGGTEYTVKKALRQGLTVINLAERLD